jgi:Cell Wall Hydrolase
VNVAAGLTALAVIAATRAAGAQDLSDIPALPVFTPPQAAASAFNLPDALTGETVAPFVLKADGETQGRAVQCLTQAVYYEAGSQSLEGQEAVAQVVLNRMRHPHFPKSVCGVVYEGAERATGCQFTFTCDGSLGRAPDARAWDAAERVAIDALAGHVARGVGAATHYHAVWMTPYWSPTLIQVRRIGGHVFYRMPGAEGAPAALTGPYLGAEPATPVVAAQVKVAAAARRRGHAKTPANGGVAEFSVWGLQVATVSAQHGELTVSGGS